MMKREFFKKNVLVLGGGESGLQAAELLRRAGACVRLSTLDALDGSARKKMLNLGIDIEEGGHTPSFFRGARILVPSPGIKPHSLPIRWARRLGMRILGEVEIASRFAQGPWIAVTGTNGKTTTSTLLWEMIRRERPADLCGNIGRAFSRSVLEKPGKTLRVVEVSSFQIYFAEKIRPDIAVFLNFTPNHLDWHKTLSEYYGSKMNLVRYFNRRNTAVVNADDPVLADRMRKKPFKKLWTGMGPLHEGILSDGTALFEVKKGVPTMIADLRGSRLIGDHNVRNLMAAAGAARLVGISRESIAKAIHAFKPIHHRLERLGAAHGVSFVNDSKSTTVGSTCAALESFRESIVLIAGGRPKERDFRALGGFLKDRVSQVVLYGEAAPLISKHIAGFAGKTVVRDFRDAVKKAYRAARPGDVVLLSPMCASFDQFKSYEERGEVFGEIFEKIRRKVNRE